MRNVAIRPPSENAITGWVAQAKMARRDRRPAPAAWSSEVEEGDMAQLIAFMLSNFTLTFLIIAAIATAISVLRRRRGEHPHLVESALAFYVLFVIGFTFLYNFVMHVFFGDVAASFIGWENSPFQAEVGWASLGFAVIGFLAYKSGFEMRLAAIVGPACFLLGAAGGHVYQMIAAGNFAPGNAGVIFYTDILVPLLGALLLWMRYGKVGRSPALSA
jgi:hypothetical protein